MAPIYAAANVPWMKSVFINLSTLASVFDQFNPSISALQLGGYRNNTTAALSDADHDNVLSNLRTGGIASIFDQINLYAQIRARALGAASQIAYPLTALDSLVTPDR